MSVEPLSKKDVKTLGEKGWNQQAVGTQFVEVGRVNENIEVVLAEYRAVMNERYIPFLERILEKRFGGVTK